MVSVRQSETDSLQIYMMLKEDCERIGVLRCGVAFQKIGFMFREGVAVIPIEDLNQIMTHGANMRLSTMNLSIFSRNKAAYNELLAANNIYMVAGGFDYRGKNSWRECSYYAII